MDIKDLEGRYQARGTIRPVAVIFPGQEFVQIKLYDGSGIKLEDILEPFVIYCRGSNVLHSLPINEFQAEFEPDPTWRKE